jgi:uncharacterized membrane protein
MRTIFRSSAIPALLTSALLAVSSAHAVDREWTVCNRTSETVSVAIARGAANGYVSEGWWKIGACGCKTVLSGDVPVTGAFLRGVSSSGRVFAGETLMCVRRGGPFTLANAESERHCRGGDRCFETFGFHSLKKPRFTTNLTGAGGGRCID